MAPAIFKRRRLLTPTEMPEPPSPLVLSVADIKPSKLVALPPELLLLLASFLPPASLVSLKLANRHLYHSLPVNFKPCDLDICASLTISSYLEGQYPGSQVKPVGTTARSLNHTHYRCLICGHLYPSSLFGRDSGPVGVGPIELPDRVCAWHKGRFTRVFRVDEAHTGDTDKWRSKMERLCSHCGQIKSWKDCKCDCGSCDVKDARVYVRFVNGQSECRQYDFFEKKGRDGGQELWVEEKSYNDDNRSNVTIKHVPVEFE